MTNRDEKICRLCLTKTKYEYEDLPEAKKQCFLTLLLEVDISTTSSPVMCKRCARNLENAFEFKNTCLQTEEIIAAFAVLSNSNVLDLKEVYLSENEADAETEAGSICRFCLKCVKKEVCMSLGVLEENVTLVKDMLPKCFPELDFDVILAPVICTPCIKSLERYLCFWRTCSEVEQKLTRYRESVSTKTPIELYDVMHFIEENLMRSVRNGSIIISIDDCDGETEQRMELGHDLDQLIVINVPSCGTVIEKSCDGMKIERNEDSECKINALKVEESNENVMEVEGVFTIALNDEYEFKNVISDGQLSDSNKTMLELNSCSTGNNYKDDIEALNKNIACEVGINKYENYLQKDNTEIETDHCSEIIDNYSENEVDKKQSLVKEKSDEYGSGEKKLSHYLEGNKNQQNQFQIAEQLTSKHTKKAIRKNSRGRSNKANLISCKLKSTDKAKGNDKSCKLSAKKKFHNCSECDFITSLGNIYQFHKQTHDNTLKNSVFECGICRYKNREANEFNRHLHLHENVKEKAKSKQKTAKAISPNNTGLYKCPLCIYRTKNEEKFDDHRKSHANGAQFKCTLCPFTAKQKNNLAVHSLTHDPKRLYKCDACTFETRRKDLLQTHMKKHRDKKSTLLKCVLCVFETKTKSCLRRHMEAHTKVAEKPNIVAQDLMIINEGGVLRLVRKNEQGKAIEG